MNNAQLMNLAVATIVGITGPAVAKIGIDPTSWSKDVADLILLGVAAFTAWKAHRFHADNPPVAK